MKTEDKELLLKVLCERLPYGVIIHIEGTMGGNYLNGDSKLVGIHNGIIHVENQSTYGNYEGFPLDTSIKPYLRRESSMTDKERKSFRELKVYDHNGCKDWYCVHHIDDRNLIDKGLALEAPEGMYKNN